MDGSTPLTLVRALSQLYNNGVSTVIAVRAAGSSVSSATYALQDANGRTIATLTARTPGTWANDMSVLVEAADADCVISSETWPATFDKLRYSPVLPSPRNRIRVSRGVTKRTDTLDIVYKRVVTNETVTPEPEAATSLRDADRGCC